MIKNLFCFTVLYFHFAINVFPQSRFNISSSDREFLINTSEGTVSLNQISGLNAVQVDLFVHNKVERLAVFDRTSGKLYFFSISENDEEFYLDEKFTNEFTVAPKSWVKFRDYDGDGNTDIWTASNLGVKVYKNKGGVNLEFDLVADPLLVKGLSNNEVNLNPSDLDIFILRDIDNDGDLDVLMYNFSTGEDLYYYRNYSQENEGNNLNLIYKLETTSFGEFKECDCEKVPYVFQGAECDYSNAVSGSRIKHIGGKSLEVFESGDYSIIAGHEQCKELFLVGDKNYNKYSFTDFDLLRDNSGRSIDLFYYPSVYDVRISGRQFLFYSTNLENDPRNDNSKSIYYSLVKAGSLETPRTLNLENYLDFGSNSVLVSYDFDQDGLKDLLVSSDQLIDGVTNAEFNYYKGISKTEFAYIDTDRFSIFENEWMNVIPRHLYLNGRDYLFINQIDKGRLTGRLSYLTDFKNGISVSEIIETQVEISRNDNYIFLDIDDDGDLELLVLKSSGTIDTYQIEENLKFSKELDPFIDIDKYEMMPLYFIEKVEDNTFVLIDTEGKWYEWDRSADHVQPLGYDSQENSFISGRKTQLLKIEDGLSNYCLLGGVSGGVGLVSLNESKEFEDNFVIFPNPQNLWVHNSLKVISKDKSQLTIYNSLGQLIFEPMALVSGINDLNISFETQGMYFFVFTSEGEVLAKRKVMVHE
ncbi:T9SS type A sorting domain-containing protein [Aureibacter tunicatorum]|uniref:Secretion system C-terminal sorting domain-containing protein n=1 Tax=Aureibacter tunicatorum TaxID=866807 RepID=A0AAE3XN83_9BACT|nr:T9SS type A sorting domain-containing protein [Aureibacter tunicatorum]MDR6238994.1 hypothetical protein [Aureibacter tunicatorum]BDD05080.1 hypothetical protein AUTU_25630 [Aureibacter tunicatorum]